MKHYITDKEIKGTPEEIFRRGYKTGVKEGVMEFLKQMHLNENMTTAYEWMQMELDIDLKEVEDV